MVLIAIHTMKYKYRVQYSLIIPLNKYRIFALHSRKEVLSKIMFIILQHCLLNLLVLISKAGATLYKLHNNYEYNSSKSKD